MRPEDRMETKLSEVKTEFKGWTIPGPIPPGAMGCGPALEPGETLDCISGHFRLFQLEKGHRFSTDDVLTAWYGTQWAGCARQVLDLGSGLGTVGMVAAWRLPGARFVTVEAQEDSVRLARKSAEWNGLNDRYEIRCGDFRDPGVLGAEDQFDLVLGSPPYFPLGAGVTGDHPQKVACRFELRGTVADYCRVAAAHLAPGGVFACVFPISPQEQELRVEQGAMEAGLTLLRRRPVVFREGERPLIGLFVMSRTADVPERLRADPWREPELIIRTRDGAVHPEYARVKTAFGFPP